jgi:hypothetical protein
MASIKEILKKTFIVSDLLKRKHIKAWIRDGRPYPPPHDVKSLALTHYALSYGLNTFVETGTYLGDTIWSLKDLFEQIYSVELSEELYRRAKKRFSGYSNIHLLQGDSSEKLFDVVRQLRTPALFWLDGHYSGGITAKGEKVCPIYDELEAVFSSIIKGHVIVIDDARLFVGKDDYPTYAELLAFINSKGDYLVRREGDEIIVTELGPSGVKKSNDNN